MTDVEKDEFAKELNCILTRFIQNKTVHKA